MTSNTYIEGKRKSFYEEYGDGMTAPNDLFDYFIEPALEEAFTFGQKSGVELAEGVVPGGFSGMIGNISANGELSTNNENAGTADACRLSANSPS